MYALEYNFRGFFCIFKICPLITECKCSHNANHILITSLQCSDTAEQGPVRCQDEEFVPGRSRVQCRSLGSVSGEAGFGSQELGRSPAGLLSSTSSSSSEVCEMSQPIMARPYWLSKCLLLLPLHRKGAQGSLPGSQTLTHHCHGWIQGRFRNPSDVGTTCPSEVWLPRSQNPDQIWGLVFYKNAVWVVKLGACRPLVFWERLGCYSGYKPWLSPTVLK